MDRGYPPPPREHQRAFDHPHRLIGMNEVIGPGEDTRMFCRHACPPPEQHDVTGTRQDNRHRLAAMPTRSLDQPISAAPLRSAQSG